MIAAETSDQERPCLRRVVRHGTPLFAEGERRVAAYRIHRGALCHYIVWPDGHHDVIEFAFPGDIVGLGALPEHISTTKALVDTEVETLGDEQLQRAVDADAELANRLSAATDREFEFVRARALGKGGRTAVQRLAAYLVAITAMGCRSGESVVAGFDANEPALANLLELPSAQLDAAWSELRGADLVETRADGLIVHDLDRLQGVADGRPQ